MSTQPPTTLVRTLGRTQYAFALVWRVLPGLQGQTAAAEAREMAVTLKMQSGVIATSGSRTIVGFASSKTRAHSAAAIAGSRGGRRLIVVALGDSLYWLCLVEDSGLVLDVDLVVDTNRASQIVQELCTAAAAKSRELTIIRTPDADLQTPWMETAEIAPIEQILPVLPDFDSRIHNLRSLSKQRQLILAAAVILPCMYAVSEWQAYTERKEQQRIALQADADARSQDIDLATNTALREAALAKAITDAIRLETRKPAPLAAISACATAMSTLGRSVAGWQVVRTRCEPLSSIVHAELAISHPSHPTYGVPAGLMEMAERLGGSVSIASGLRTATLSYPLPALDIRPGMDSTAELPSWDAVLQGPGTAVLRRSRGQRSFSYSISDPILRPITYIDPAGISADGSGPVELEVPPNLAFRETTIALTAPYQVPDVLQHLDGDHVRTISVEASPGLPQITIILSLLVRP